MHNRGISLHLLHKRGNLIRHCYWSPVLFYGYTAGYLARILRLEYRSTRFWASIYGLAIVKMMGVTNPLFSQLAYTSKCIFLMRMVPLPIRYDHYVNRTPGQLTKLMHLISLMHIYDLKGNVDLRTSGRNSK